MISIQCGFAPDFLEQLVDGGFGGFEFAVDEGVEVIDAEVGFGHLGEELLGVGEGVVADPATGGVEGTVAMARLLVGLPTGGDARFVKAQHLVVISVS